MSVIVPPLVPPRIQHVFPSFVASSRRRLRRNRIEASAAIPMLIWLSLRSLTRRSSWGGSRPRRAVPCRELSAVIVSDQLSAARPSPESLSCESRREPAAASHPAASAFAPPTSAPARRVTVCGKARHCLRQGASLFAARRVTVCGKARHCLRQGASLFARHRSIRLVNTSSNLGQWSVDIALAARPSRVASWLAEVMVG
jgi:hypothetical protein